MGASAKRLLASVAMAALVTACQTTREQESQVKPELARTYLSDKPETLKKHFLVTMTQGERNRVLNHMRLGLAAMELGDDRLAEQMLDDALASIETLYTNDANAAKARDLFTKELVKDFKGEPYERSMAYYYRGLLYLKAGDYDNARASFKGGYIQDSFADEDQHRADFALLQYLQGWASRCRGNTPTAEDDFREFRVIKPDFPLPGDNDDTLLLVETGSAPVKYSATANNDTKPRFLKYRRASATESARIQLSDAVPQSVPPNPAPPKKGAKAAPPPPAVRQVDLPMLEDVYFQASTRGGRPFDSILAGKAQFQDAANTIGNVALTGAVIAANVAVQQNRRRNDDGATGAAAAAGILLLTGLIAKGVADASEPDADTRYWDNLPDRVHAVSLQLPPSVQSISVDFLGHDGTTLRNREARVVRAGTCNLAWARGESAIPANPRAPYSAPTETMFAPVVLPAAEPDKPDQPSS